MIWPILHRLFGWHYVHLQNTAHGIIRRVHYTRSGEPYVIYFTGNLVFLARPNRWEITLLTGEVKG